ncbi:hypothetical protein [uncultured Mediterranean phage uvMED]|nr:hypothetical protein [uncultured Mediterranean phage uvMED]
MAYISFQPKDYFNTVTFTGNSSTQSITGVGFQPDWVWFKNRAQAYDHQAFDAVRAVTKRISPNTDSTESTQSASLTSFDSDGFSVGNYNPINESPNGIVSWNWKANGSGSSNTDGSITSTVSANTTSGFSIVTYTGTGSNATIGHSLNAVPKMIIVKNLTNANAWSVYHASLGATKYLALNETDAVGTASDRWQDTTPTSSVFSIGTNANQGGSYNYIAYCFAEKKGFSKFGSYTGNGEASDNAFIYTGFKVGWVMIKATDADEWRIYDNKRANPFNVIDVRLKANASDAESSGNNECDFLSNGIKIRSNSGGVGSSGQEYIYMCFAEEPLVSSNGVPATAR